jgi:hypothetical protein
MVQHTGVYHWQELDKSQRSNYLLPFAQNIRAQLPAGGKPFHAPVRSAPEPVQTGPAYRRYWVDILIERFKTIAA